MQFLWEWVSYKTNHHENYIKVLVVTFIVGVTNLNLRREIMFWFKTSQLQKSHALEIKCMESRLGDGFETLLASRESGILLRVAVSLLSSPGSPGVNEGGLRSSASGFCWFYFTQQLLEG